MPAEPTNNSYSATSALLRYCPQTALDAVFGVAGLINTDRKIEAVSKNWDGFMAKSGRGDLSRNAVLGGSVVTFFRNEDQKRVFESLLGSMTSGELSEHNQVIDLGSKNNPYYVQLSVQPLWIEGVFCGYFLHAVDVTREHSNRLTLMERDRELAQFKQGTDSSKAELENARAALQQAVAEKSAREKQITELTEKAARQAKSLKQSVQRSEQTANEKAELENEIQRLRQTTGNSEELTVLKTQAANLNEEITRRAAEVEFVKARCDTYEEEIAKLNSQLKEWTSKQENSGQEATKWQQQYEELQTSHSTLEKEWTAKIEKADQESAKWQNQCEALQGTLATLENDVANLREQLTATVQKLSEKAAEPSAPVSSPTLNGNNIRILSRDLADQFGNLLTGVLGHASLAEAEADAAGAAMEDIHAIEKTAREAAQLVRKLSALSGSGRHTPSTELGTYLIRYAAKDHPGAFDAGVVKVETSGSLCGVPADQTTLDVVFDSASRYSCQCLGGESNTWDMKFEGSVVTVTLSLGEEPRLISGWDGGPAPQVQQDGYELYFAREAVRGLAGEIEITAGQSEWTLVVTLPAVPTERRERNGHKQSAEAGSASKS